MKKNLKIILIGILILVGLFVIDFICIFKLNRTILAIKKSEYEYKGILYDTYICSEYTVPQIKRKGTKFTCTNIEIN